MQTFVLMFWAFGVIGVYCCCGDMVTNGFEIISDELSQSKWYFFSLEMQKMLIIFSANTQQPAIIRGYGNITCSRETFKNVRELSKPK